MARPAAAWPRRRLLVLAVLLPAIVAVTNQLLLETFPSAWLRTWFYPSLVLSTAVLSWCAGRYLYPAWLRWILFVWCLALLELLTIVACMTGKLADQFAYVLVSAQMSLLILWAVLGSGPWQWRLPIAGALLRCLRWSVSHVRQNEAGIFMLVAAPIIALLCGGLRLLRLRVARLAWKINPRASCRQAPHLPVRHEAHADLVHRQRAIAAVSFAAWISADEAIFPAALLAVTVATVNLTAIWAVLGAGHWIIRVAAMLGVPFLIALGMSYYSAYLKSPPSRRPGTTFRTTIAWVIVEMQDHWIAWLWLDAALLAALLLFLRASGYRLMRLRTRLS